ncbi:MAG: hypothetical protein QXP92_04430 [Nitrososphaerota archaeon]
MLEAGVLVKPPTRKADVETLEVVRRLRPQAILLNFPENIEEIVYSYSKGLIDYDEFVESISEKLPEPKSTWIKGFEVLLRELPGIGELADIFCYTDVELFDQEAATSVEIALLAIKCIVREKIDVEEWVKVLKKSVIGEDERLGREFSKIIDVAQNYERVICISGFEGKYIKRRLEQAGVKSWIRYLGMPYHFTPLEILKRLIMLDKIDKELFSKLIKEHIRFLREYVYYMSYADAVEKWVRERLYWLPIGRVQPG